MMTVVKTQLHERKVKSEGRVVLPVCLSVPVAGPA